MTFRPGPLYYFYLQSCRRRGRKGSCICPNPNHPEGSIITITAADENGRETDQDFRVIAIYPAGGRQYIALTPDLDTPELEADIYLFRYLEEGGQSTVEEIPEDEEFALAADALQQVQLSRPD